MSIGLLSLFAESEHDSGAAPLLSANEFGTQFGLLPREKIELMARRKMIQAEGESESEVLALFDRQAAGLVSRMRSAPPGSVTSVAHTLKGSARGVGAWRVAAAAEAVEVAASGDGDLSAAITRLAAGAEEARAVIAELLRAN